MKILAIDTAMNACSAAAFDGERGVCVRMSEPMVRGQAERLVPMLEELLRKASWEWRAISAIAVTVGPGAFTGLRIGLSTARALGVSLGVPVGGVTTLDVIARAVAVRGVVAEGQELAILIDTKRDDYYFQRFDPSGKALDEPRAASSEEIASVTVPDTLFAGDGAARFVNGAGLQGARLPGFDLVDPSVVADLALGQIRRGEPFARAEPLYLRSADVSKPKRLQRVLEQAMPCWRS
ncbi:MAG: tRNA (adenosine(37)-N6)-threonylcarbamoyltransferase complex dimerization subunit type 1 TsaB [Alphaproteobacteria bacterium]|nr:tRNA (adenosine(37)-N6)-threonylcarbamoyltransferase complex dimerization subunit type 1 TsaB [Alphaproteobacteria bacterium]